MRQWQTVVSDTSLTPTLIMTLRPFRFLFNFSPAKLLFYQIVFHLLQILIYFKTWANNLYAFCFAAIAKIVLKLNKKVKLVFSLWLLTRQGLTRPFSISLATDSLKVSTLTFNFHQPQELKVMLQSFKGCNLKDFLTQLPKLFSTPAAFDDFTKTKLDLSIPYNNTRLQRLFSTQPHSTTSQGPNLSGSIDFSDGVRTNLRTSWQELMQKRWKIDSTVQILALKQLSAVSKQF